MLTQEQKERYHRHLIIPGFSEAEQEHLFNASVLVIGAGGLGSPVLQYLGAAGVGTIGIVDNDHVTISNLQRQILYGEAEDGKLKVEYAAKRILANNSKCKVKSFIAKWESGNAEQIAKDFDLIIDCTDNYLSRITTDNVSKLLGIPFVYGAINEWEGQVSVFNYQGGKSYQEIFNLSENNKPELKGPIGVLGVTPAVIGSLQAVEAIKLITKQGDVLSGKMLHVLLKNNLYQIMEF